MTDAQVAVAGLVVNIFALIMVGTQLALLRRQVTDAAGQFTKEQDRARRQSALEFITATMDRRQRLRASVPTINEKEEYARFMASLPVDRQAVRDLNQFLSYYESLAVGANDDIIDREILRRAWGGTIINAFESYRGFIYSRREALGRPTLYCELEELSVWLKARRDEDAALIPAQPVQLRSQS